MSIFIASGSYHNLVLSRALPKQESSNLENQIVTTFGVQGESQQQNNQQKVLYEHRDDDCPNMEQMKKLKSEIKRLRQELVLKPSSKQNDDDDIEEGFTDEEKAAIRQLS